MTTERQSVVTARDVMTPSPLAVAGGASVWAAWSLMSRTGLRHLLVLGIAGAVGIVDDRTVFAQWPMGPLALRRRRVAEIMRVDVQRLSADADVRDVAAVMAEKGIDAVPIVDGTGTLIGIVTSSDLARCVARYGCMNQS